jgi:hypothetical protein
MDVVNRVDKSAQRTISAIHQPFIWDKRSLLCYNCYLVFNLRTSVVGHRPHKETGYLFQQISQLSSHTETLWDEALRSIKLVDFCLCSTQKLRYDSTASNLYVKIHANIRIRLIGSLDII